MSSSLAASIRDLKWARYWDGGGIGREAVLGGRRYWEGGGIRREAVEGGGIWREAVLGGRRY